MKVLPNQLKSRLDINYRHGIKSSLSEMSNLLGLVIALYDINNQNASIQYSVESSTTPKLIRLKNNFLDGLNSFFRDQIEVSNIVNFSELVNANPLFTAQIEPLQVVFELFFKIGKVYFNGRFPFSKERTGGDRFDKTIDFSSNMDLLALAISESNGEYEEKTKNLLFNWITGQELPIDEVKSEKIKTILTIFSEDTQYKLRYENEQERFFQSEGIYEEIIKGNDVISIDQKELVGPFRIMKSFLRSNIHPFLIDQDSVFKKNPKIEDEKLKNHASKVSTYLDLIYRPKTIFSENTTQTVNSFAQTNLKAKQTIYYGCPGTGKSKTIEKETEGVSSEFIFRTTFHPEYDYASFVGSYKPIMVSHEGTTPSVSYDFVPQVFTQAYVSALQNPEQAHYLIIEEINRGNCALIFGDIFQLLDRQAGISEYAIRADRDLEHYLSDVLKEKYQNTEGLRLPANLSILATMNTSDQSLFPMDSAFKRRWDWIYVPIHYEKANEYKISVNLVECSWGDFLKTINAAVLGITESEDKQLGTFFVKPVNGFISETQLINKVMFYLWSDIFKNEDKNSPHYLFKYLKDGVEDTFTYNQLHTEEKSVILDGFFKKWGINCEFIPPMPNIG
jgi:AAA domain (dynein-related subfamily)